MTEDKKEEPQHSHEGKHHHKPDFGERARVPDYRIYKVEDAPDLLEIQQVLAARGLKDPWLRNEVWRFRTCEWGTHRQRLMTFLFRGIHWAIPAFIATIIGETAISMMGGGGGSHSSHSDHGHDKEPEPEKDDGEDEN